MAKYALCIGINDYPGTDSDLSGCVNDANDWAAALTNEASKQPRYTTKRPAAKICAPPLNP